MLSFSYIFCELDSNYCIFYQISGGSGGGRGNRGNNSNSGSSYFHPSMIEDPWAGLYQKDSKIEQNYDMNADTSLSDSLMPQVGDSFYQINSAPDVPDNLDQTLNATEDLSKYR